MLFETSKHAVFCRDFRLQSCLWWALINTCALLRSVFHFVNVSKSNAVCLQSCILIIYIVCISSHVFNVESSSIWHAFWSLGALPPKLFTDNFVQLFQPVSIQFHDRLTASDLELWLLQLTFGNTFCFNTRSYSSACGAVSRRFWVDMECILGLHLFPGLGMQCDSEMR